MTPDDTDAERPAAKPKNFFAANAVNTLVVVALIFLFALVLLPAIITRNPHGALDRQNSNNLTQLALAQHAFADYTRSGLVGPYAFANGAVNQGHSFRVSLLPYMEEDGLFKQIDLTQPWDSPRNAPVTSVAIRNLQSPDTRDREKPDTPYRVFYGGGALFAADGTPVKLTDIPDGASNTILFVHATETVPWAKPQEFAYTPATPLPPLGSPGLSRGGFNAAMADGSVRFFNATIAEADLRSLIEKADGRGRDIE